MKQSTYILKQPNSSRDYKIAYDIVESLKRGSTTAVVVDNVKRFRRYLYHLGYCRNHSYSTRKTSDLNINVTRIL